MKKHNTYVLPQAIHVTNKLKLVGQIVFNTVFIVHNAYFW